jgi:hypothetical protein
LLRIERAQALDARQQTRLFRPLACPHISFHA